VSPGLVSVSPTMVSVSPSLVSVSPGLVSVSPGLISVSPGLVSVYIYQVGQLNIPVYIIGWTMKGGGEGRVGDMPASGAVATD